MAGSMGMGGRPPPSMLTRSSTLQRNIALFQRSSQHSEPIAPCDAPRGRSSHGIPLRHGLDSQQQARQTVLCGADSKAVGAVALDGQEGAMSQSSFEDAASATSMMEILRFTLPTLGVWIINPVLSLVDTAVVGTKSSVELAALGPGTLLCDYTAYTFTFLAIATVNMMAVTFARGDKKAAGSLISDALAISLVIGVALAAIIFTITMPALTAIAGQASSVVVGPAADYVRIRCLGLPAAMVIFVTQAFFLAAKDPYTPLIAAVAAGAINLAGDLLLVNVFGLGIKGAAWATAAAQIVTAGILVRSLLRPLRATSAVPGMLVDVRLRLPSPQAALSFFQYAGPICIILFTKTITYGMLTRFASCISPISSGAHHVLFTVYGFYCTFGDAVSQAAQTYLPSAVGKPRAAWALGRQVMQTGAVIGMVNSIAAGAVVLLLPHLFTNNAAVTELMASLVPLMSATLILHTCSMATEGLLLGGRDLKFLVLSYAANAAMVLAGLALYRHLGWGLVSVWLCVLQFQGIRLGQNWRRLTSPASPLNTRKPLTDAMAAAT